MTTLSEMYAQAMRRADAQVRASDLPEPVKRYLEGLFGRMSAGTDPIRGNAPGFQRTVEEATGMPRVGEGVRAYAERMQSPEARQTLLNMALEFGVGGLPKKAVEQGYQRGFFRGGRAPNSKGELGNQHHFSRDREYAEGVFNEKYKSAPDRDFREYAIAMQKPFHLRRTYTTEDILPIQDALKAIGDKRLSPYLKEIVEDDYGGAIPGSALHQLLDQVGIEPARSILQRAGFDAIDSGRDIEMLVPYGVRDLSAKFDKAKRYSPNIFAGTIGAMAIPGAFSSLPPEYRGE